MAFISVRLLSNYTTVSGNNITDNDYGVSLHEFFNNTVSGNNITNNNYGAYIWNSSYNKFHHNNFINNTNQVYSELSANTWDDGYPSGGNYWSDYVDKYPNSSELNGSGLWDTPYVIDSYNQDNYPKIPEFTSATLLPMIIILATTAMALTKRKTQQNSRED